MPLGFTRLNEAKQRPNPNVNFYKPLEGPDKDVSLEFLSRLAAIAAPIMRQNHCLVNSLEEFPPNREFWGRNFNAGECIQIVLKSPSTGRWLPRRFVEMVFMHELAHCKQMNHSRAFWKVRNAYSTELRDLWSKNYIGDGVWGQGHSLGDGQLIHEALPAADEQMVRNLCGGTYRGARGKRKRGPKAEKPQLSYAERKQKRIAKKFGTAGQELGDDEETRAKLEHGKRVKGKPRVASSNRARELRAAALLDRLENAKAEKVKTEPTDSGTDDESDFEEMPPKDTDVVDANGKRFIQVCEGEDDGQDIEAKNELMELFQNDRKATKSLRAQDTSHQQLSAIDAPEETSSEDVKPDISKAESELYEFFDHSYNVKDEVTNNLPSVKVEKHSLNNNTSSEKRCSVRTGDEASIDHCSISTVKEKAAVSSDCSVCSLMNDMDAITCTACGHVLWPDKLPGTWRCEAESCAEARYVNHRDNSFCGLCGTPKQTSEA